MTPPTPTLTPEGAHNAVANLVAMYQGILADYERKVNALAAQLAAQAAAHADQLKEGRMVNSKLLQDVQELRQQVARLVAAQHVEGSVGSVGEGQAAVEGRPDQGVGGGAPGSSRTLQARGQVGEGEPLHAFLTPDAPRG